MPPGRVMCNKTTVILLLLEFFRQKIMLEMVRFYEEDFDQTAIACHLLVTEISSLLVERVNQIRVTDYIERILPGQTANQFQEHFRMNRNVFDVVLQYLGPKLRSVNKFSPHTRLIDPQRQLLAVLWLLATPDSFRSVGDRFNLGKASLHKAFINVINVLNNISKHIIKWPQGHERQTAQGFFQCSRIPGVIGAIDGSYINIKAPHEYPERYINRKCSYAITVQAVCNCNLYFTDIFAGYPSSVSDRRIFHNSDLYKKLRDGVIVIPNNYFIVGDKAYPVLKWLITPYIERQALNESQKKFNTAIAKTRQCIERAFALLKGRFRRLKYLDMSRTDLIPAVILACCVLHNLCLLNDTDTNYIANYILEGMVNVEAEPTNSNVNNAENENEGENLRERIRQIIDQQSA